MVTETWFEHGHGFVGWVLEIPWTDFKNAEKSNTLKVAKVCNYLKLGRWGGDQEHLYYGVSVKAAMRFYLDWQERAGELSSPQLNWVFFISNPLNENAEV